MQCGMPVWDAADFVGYRVRSIDAGNSSAVRPFAFSSPLPASGGKIRPLPGDPGYCTTTIF